MVDYGYNSSIDTMPGHGSYFLANALDIDRNNNKQATYNM